MCLGVIAGHWAVSFGVVIVVAVVNVVDAKLVEPPRMQRLQRVTLFAGTRTECIEFHELFLEDFAFDLTSRFAQFVEALVPLLPDCLARFPSRSLLFQEPAKILVIWDRGGHSGMMS